MRLKKRFMAILLVAAMVITGVPVTAAQTDAEGLTSSDLNFRKFYTTRLLFRYSTHG